jgi:hypothetical protein
MRRKPARCYFHTSSLWVLALIISGIFSCSDAFVEAIDTEKLAVRESENTIALILDTSIVSFFEGSDPLVNRGVFRARLASRPEHDVVMDLAPFTAYGLVVSEETVTFTPDDYSVEKEISISVTDNGLVSGTNHYRVSLPPLSSLDPLYNGLTVPDIEVTVYEDDQVPIVYPVRPEINEVDVELYPDIRILFNKDMNPASINDETVKLLDDKNVKVPAYMHYDVSSRTVKVSPKQYLRPYTSHVIYVTDQVVDVGGNPVLNGEKWLFKTRKWDPPKLMSSISTPNYANSVIATGTHAYYGDKNALRILDISDPETPVELGNYPVSGETLNIQVRGNLAYIASNGAGLYTIDISNPSSPGFISLFNSETACRYVRLKGNYAYVTCSKTDEGVLLAVDVSTPSAPSEKGRLTLLYPAYGIGVSGNYAYVADSSNYMNVIDISNPSSMSLKTRMPCYGPKGMTVTDTHAYTGGGSSYIAAVDITDPLNPSLARAFNTSVYNATLHVAGKTAYTASGYDLRIIDVSDLSSTVLSTVSYSVGQPVYDVYPAGGIVCVAASNSLTGVDRRSYLNMYEVISPKVPTMMGYYKTPGSANHTTVKGTTAFIADGIAGIHVIDITNPAFPLPVAAFNTSGSANTSCLNGDYLYVADGSSGLLVLDISDPPHPQAAGSLSLTNSKDIVISGNRAYIADGANGLRIVDIAVPGSPQLLGTLDLDDAYGVAVNGNIACVADGSSGLRIINVTNPAVPSLTSTINPGGTAKSVRVRDSIAYLSTDASGLYVIDISAPSNPAVVSSIDTGGSARGLYLYNDYILVADGSGGIQVFHSPNPNTLVKVGEFGNQGNANNVIINGNMAHVSDGTSGFVTYIVPW